MSKPAAKKKAALPVRNSELVQLGATKSTLKKIKRGHQEIQRLIRALVAVRAATDRELRQFTNSVADRQAERAVSGDDSLEAAHG